MKRLFVLIAVFSCGGYEIEEENTVSETIRQDEINTLRFHRRRTEMVWHIQSAYCGSGWGPYVELYDITNGETWGPLQPGLYSGQMDIKISCVVGDTICYGGWFVQKGFYDCSSAEQTHECVYVAEDPEYFWWGCGLGCKHLANSFPLTCHDCVIGAEKSKYLNCGN